MLLDVTCKTGKLQVTEEGIMRIVPLFGKNVVWQIPCNTVVKFATQSTSLGIITLFVYATGVPTYQIETFAERHFPKLQVLFPHVPVEKREKPRYWYQDTTKRAYVATYTKEKDMQREVEQAAQHGWIPQGTAGTAGHINVGRTVTAAALTGGASLLFGASRSKDKLTITYVRTPEWLAQN
jgi:hypothetical protein